jgi:ribosome-associated protein
MTNEEDFDHKDPTDQDEEWVSKSQAKRDMHALQELGKKLVALNKDQLAKVPMDETLREAVDECRRLKKGEAIRRQLQLADSSPSR